MTSSIAHLKRRLEGLDGKPYGAYKQLAGERVAIDDVTTLVIDRIQSDPYAPPSLAHLELDRAALELGDLRDPIARIAAADFLARSFRDAIRGERALGIGHIGQEVLERTHCVIEKKTIIVRFTVHLPAAGRRIKGRAAAATLSRGLVDAIAQAFTRLDYDGLDAHIILHRDREAIRKRLQGLGLIAFVGDGAILPRCAGNSDLPLEDAIPFRSPDNLRIALDVPSGETITGMAVPEGVTVIVGGGYHGKSTLLRALEAGVYAHIPGDGREWVITRPDAVSIRAEDGRAVTDTDISDLIADLPSGTDTRRFTTTNASGSTSQAANLIEALDSGATTLLIDEDTSATNFMIRDSRMRELIAPDREPITPFVDKVRSLHDDNGVSTVLVAGGSGAFFSVADRVLALDSYQVTDVTAKAHAIAAKTPEPEPANPSWHPRSPRLLQTRDESLISDKATTSRGGKTRDNKKKPASAKGRTTIRYGRNTIDLGPANQIVDPGQTTHIAHALDAVHLDGDRDVVEEVRRVAALPLEEIAPYRGHPGLYARAREHEILAAINRFRFL